jgi:hypothetical protein
VHDFTVGVVLGEQRSIGVDDVIDVREVTCLFAVAVNDWRVPIAYSER